MSSSRHTVNSKQILIFSGYYCFTIYIKLRKICKTREILTGESQIPEVKSHNLSMNTTSINS